MTIRRTLKRKSLTELAASLSTSEWWSERQGLIVLQRRRFLLRLRCAPVHWYGRQGISTQITGNEARKGNLIRKLSIASRVTKSSFSFSIVRLKRDSFNSFLSFTKNNNFTNPQYLYKFASHLHTLITFWKLRYAFENTQSCLQLPRSAGERSIHFLLLAQKSFSLILSPYVTNY